MDDITKLLADLVAIDSTNPEYSNNISGEKFAFLNLNLLQSRLSWSITLRWLAVSGYFISTLIAKYLFLLPLPYEKIWFVLDV